MQNSVKLDKLELYVLTLNLRTLVLCK